MRDLLVMGEGTDARLGVSAPGDVAQEALLGVSELVDLQGDARLRVVSAPGCLALEAFASRPRGNVAGKFRRAWCRRRVTLGAE